MRDLLFIECTPKKDDIREGIVLHEFLNMTDTGYRGRFELHEISSKNKLISLLEDKEYLKSFKGIHLSGHGTNEGGRLGFKLPHGVLHPDEFPRGCFNDKIVGFSACDLGKIDFCRNLLGNTGFKCFIAPQRGVKFMDAAIWFLTLYYLYVGCNKQIWTAYNETNEKFNALVKGAFQYYEP
ncbi:hypothetical protein [Methanoplanus limicola]|nr:hypothetical protein [Methanoplanus limicola]